MGCNDHQGYSISRGHAAALLNRRYRDEHWPGEDGFIAKPDLVQFCYTLHCLLQIYPPRSPCPSPQLQFRPSFECHKLSPSEPSPKSTSILVPPSPPDLPRICAKSYSGVDSAGLFSDSLRTRLWDCDEASLVDIGKVQNHETSHRLPTGALTYFTSIHSIMIAMPEKKCLIRYETSTWKLRMFLRFSLFTPRSDLAPLSQRLKQ